MTLKELVIVITIFFSSSYLLPVSASEKISYINVDVILNNSDLGKTIINKLNKQNSINLDKITVIENEIKKENEEITKIKNIITKEEFDNRLAVLKKKIDNYNILKKKISNDMNQFKKEEIKIFFEKINPIIQKYMDENSISIILDKKNIFVARSDYDITENILNLINKNLKQ